MAKDYTAALQALAILTEGATSIHKTHMDFKFNEL